MRVSMNMITRMNYGIYHVLHPLMWSNKTFDVGTHHVLHYLMWSNKFVGCGLSDVKIKT